MRTAKILIRLGDAQADLSLRWAHTHFVGSNDFEKLNECSLSKHLSIVSNLSCYSVREICFVVNPFITCICSIQLGLACVQITILWVTPVVYFTQSPFVRGQRYEDIYEAFMFIRLNFIRIVVETRYGTSANIQITQFLVCFEKTFWSGE